MLISLQNEIYLLCRTDRRAKLVSFCQLNSVVFHLAEYGALLEKVDEIK